MLSYMKFSPKIDHTKKGQERFFYPTERVPLSNFETVEEIQNTSVSLGNHFD